MPGARIAGLVLAAVIAVVICAGAWAAPPLRGTWHGTTYQKTGRDIGFPNKVILRIGKLQVGHIGGHATYPPERDAPSSCHGPLRYLGRSPRGGYRFYYSETNSRARDDGECTDARILLVLHGARLFMRDSDRTTTADGSVSLGSLYRGAH